MLAELGHAAMRNGKIRATCHTRCRDRGSAAGLRRWCGGARGTGAAALHAATTTAVPMVPTANDVRRGASMATMIDRDLESVLLDEDQINECVQRLGRSIGADYEHKSLLILGVSNRNGIGARFVWGTSVNLHRLLAGTQGRIYVHSRQIFHFIEDSNGDLIRHIEPCPTRIQVDFIKASSYGSGTESSGEVTIEPPTTIKSIAGKHILLVEDIVDSGLTASRIKERMLQAGAATVRLATLLDKRSRRTTRIEPDYVGFDVRDCPDGFVVGYGIDYDEKYRHLPCVGILKPSLYQKIGVGTT